MKSQYIFYITAAVVPLLTVISSGYLEYHRKTTEANNKKESKIIAIASLGLARLFSLLGVALLSAGLIAALLSKIISPIPEEMMPLYLYSGSYSTLDWGEIDIETVREIFAEAEERVATDPENAYADLAHAYFYTHNYDKAIVMLEEACAYRESWEYLADIGVCYAFLRDYNKSLDYLNESLQLNPPFVERGVIFEAKLMVESYLSSWILSIIH